MQNQTLPIQLSPVAIAPPASNRTNIPANNDAPAFSQTLNREMAQRQEMASQDKTPDAPPAQPANTPIKTTNTAAPKTPGTRAEGHPANVDNAQAQSADAPAGDAATATAVAPAVAPADTSTDTVTADAATEGAAAAAPMTDMLAMLATYKQLMQGGAAPKAPAATADAPAASVRGTGIAADTQTLASLQTALKKTDAPVADTGTDKPAVLATPEDGATKPAATTRTAPDLAAVATRAAPQSESTLSTLRDAAVTATSKDTAPVTGSAFQAQLTSAAMVQTAVTPTSDHIPARLGTTAWDNQVSQKVVWMVGGADQTASLTLNPPDLGPVQVVLNVNNDQATVAFSSATPEVREALQNAMPHLKEMLSQAGVTLGEASVNANMPDQRQADTSQSSGNNGRSGTSGNSGNGVRTGETDVPLPRAARATRDDGVVDTFA